MACGLPVVATRVGGLPEVLEDGVTGLLVPAADPAALSEAMVKTWNDPGRCDRMGRAGRRRAEECFDVCRMVAGYETLYAEAAGDDRQSSTGPGVGQASPSGPSTKHTLNDRSNPQPQPAEAHWTT